MAVLSEAPAKGLTILLLAGEASGDNHGAALVRELARRVPGARFVGLGGPRMASEGVELLSGLDDLSVMGFAEVLPRLGFFLKLEFRIKRLLSAGAVDLVIPIDYPGFNLRVASAAHALGVPVLYYIAPQVWAWRPARARRLAECTRHVAVILPFEAPFLRAAGARVSFVGHPLLDRPDDVLPREAFCRRWGLEAKQPILAVLPGSRRQEIGRHLELFSAAAARVANALPEVQAVIARSPNLPAALFAGTSLPLVDDARGLLHHARAALVKSGTSTLEAALEGVPFVSSYRTSALTWMIGRRLMRVKYVSLPNLVADASIVPELLQDEATPVALSGALVPLLDPLSPERLRQLEGLERVCAALGSPGAAGRVADIAVRLLEQVA